jgi:hypothetical protein
MAQDHKENRAAVERAARLREQIEKLRKPSGGTQEDAQDKGHEPMSPREFIHKCMRELDSKKQP